MKKTINLLTMCILLCLWSNLNALPTKGTNFQTGTGTDAIGNQGSSDKNVNSQNVTISGSRIENFHSGVDNVSNNSTIKTGMNIYRSDLKNARHVKNYNYLSQNNASGGSYIDTGLDIKNAEVKGQGTFIDNAQVGMENNAANRGVIKTGMNIGKLSGKKTVIDNSRIENHMRYIDNNADGGMIDNGFDISGSKISNARQISNYNYRSRNNASSGGAIKSGLSINNADVNQSNIYNHHNSEENTATNRGTIQSGLNIGQ